MRRQATLSALAVLLTGLLLAVPASASDISGQSGRADEICFTTSPGGGGTDFRLEVVARGRSTFLLMGTVNISPLGPPQVALPVFGSARLRADGKVEFGLQSGGYILPFNWSGILDPPDFNSGDGRSIVQAIGAITGGTTVVTYTALAPCPEPAGDLAD